MLRSRLPHLRLPRPARSGVAVVALGALLLAGCMSTDERSAFNAVNHDRSVNGGLAPLGTNDALVTKAEGWAQHLASASGGVCSSATLVHSTLTQGAPAGWKKLGENIACRTTNTGQSSAIGPIETQFMGSPGHRANILDPQFNRGGIGVASVPASTGGGWIVVFETQDFAQL